MTKLLSASLLAFGAMVTTPAAASDPAFGGHLYIQDPNMPITLFAGQYGTPGVAYSIHSTIVSIGTIDSNGNMVDDWMDIFLFIPDMTPNQSGVVLSTVINPALLKPGTANNLLYQASADAYEVVFKWTNQNTGKTYYSDALGLNNPGSILPYTFVTYDNSANGDKNTWSTIGFEHEDGAAGIPGKSWDFNDAFVTMTNVGATGRLINPDTPATPAIPEPEAYMMMLAGLGMVGLVSRSRRKCPLVSHRRRNSP